MVATLRVDAVLVRERLRHLAPLVSGLGPPFQDVEGAVGAEGHADGVDHVGLSATISTLKPSGVK